MVRQLARSRRGLPNSRVRPCRDVASVLNLKRSIARLWRRSGAPMLQLPAATPYDLNFRLLDIPVRINPFFWLVAALLG